MIRRATIAFCLCAYCLSFGCGEGSADKDKNPNPKLEYSTEGPPKREGAKGEPTGTKAPKQ